MSLTQVATERQDVEEQGTFAFPENYTRPVSMREDHTYLEVAAGHRCIEFEGKPSCCPDQGRGSVLGFQAICASFRGIFLLLALSSRETLTTWSWLSYFANIGPRTRRLGTG